MAARAKYVRFRTYAGTPNELEEGEHQTESLAKAWMRTRMRARLKWATRYSLKAAKELEGILEQSGAINLTEAKVGRSWQWEAQDDVSHVRFMFKVEVVA